MYRFETCDEQQEAHRTMKERGGGEGGAGERNKEIHIGLDLRDGKGETDGRDTQKLRGGRKETKRKRYPSCTEKSIMGRTERAERDKDRELDSSGTRHAPTSYRSLGS